MLDTDIVVPLILREGRKREGGGGKLDASFEQRELVVLAIV